MRTDSGVARRLRRALPPLDRRAWADSGFALASAGLSVPPVALLVLPWIVYTPISLVAVVTCLLVPMIVVLVLCPWLAAVRGRCLRANWAVPPSQPQPLRQGQGVVAVVADHLRRASTWRQLLYLVVAAPAANLLGLVAAVAWVAAQVLILTSPIWAVVALAGGRGSTGGRGRVVVVAILVGCLAAMWVMPRVMAASLSLDRAAARRLLGPRRVDELTDQVAGLTLSRDAAVDAADAERRRIERDLHDGAQQRLVSLALTLGLARATMTDLPDETRQVLADAHEEAKAALAELRDLARGLHPAILEDRGLDAALSAIAARCPVPVELRVDLPQRVRPSIEAAAYFIVSEALVNVAKHARAGRALVDVSCHEGWLHVTVSDDGVGGVDPCRGTGVAGLARRAASVDGVFTVTSPLGGPTTIEAVLPCGR